MNKIRWGILSTAKIGVEKVIPAMQKGMYTQVVAIASRSTEKAREAASRLGIPRFHGSYDALLADPEVDAVYNPLPNDQHVPWSIKALEAGKHVLCEKPIGLSAAEGRQLVEAGRRYPRLKLMEAFMYRHHPQWRKAKELVQSGQIGVLRTIQTFFSFYNDDPANIRHNPAQGGGGLMDIGCYPISLSRWLFAAEPRRVIALVEYDPRFKVDRLASAILEFGTGHATFTCSMQVAPFQQVHIVGSEGRIELADVPFNAPNDRPCVLRFQRGNKVTPIEFEVCDQYTIQGDLFAQAILHDTPVPTPIEDAVRNMEVIEAIVAAGRSGSWVRIGGAPQRTDHNLVHPL
jgi:predicted dehydrogenase